MNRSLLTTALCLALLPIGVTAFADDMPMPINADQVKWDPAPPNIPPGAQLAVIAGNPAAEGQPYVIRLKMPTNYKIPAHYHPVAESVTVISGEFSVGMGDKLDAARHSLAVPVIVASHLGEAGHVGAGENAQHRGERAPCGAKGRATPSPSEPAGQRPRPASWQTRHPNNLPSR